LRAARLTTHSAKIISSPALHNQSSLSFSLALDVIRKVMRELFPPVPEREELLREQHGVGNVVVNEELRFNGDIKAFVSGDIRDIYELMAGNVIWLNRNVLACDEEMTDTLFDFFALFADEVRFQFDQKKTSVDLSS
jgi:hypothetical protein